MAFVFSLAAVSFVVLFAQSFRLLSFVLDNASTAWIFLQLMGLLVPTFLPLIAPIALGVGVLFMYHKFAIDSELVVMQSAGLSPLRLSVPALSLAALVCAFCFFLTTWATPAAHRALVDLQYSVKDNYSVFLVKPGAFNDLAEGLTFYARARNAEGGLEDILVHDVRKPETPQTIMAQTGQFAMIDGTPKIIVFKGKQQEIDRATGRLSQWKFDRYVLDLQILRKNSTAARLPDPREQSMQELFNPPEDPAKRRTSLNHIQAELHQRLATPLLSFGYAMIALAAILAGEFNRRGMTQRVFFATVGMIVLQASMLSLSSLVGRHVWMFPLLYLAALLPVPLCLLLLTAPRKKRPAQLEPKDGDDGEAKKGSEPTPTPTVTP